MKSGKMWESKLGKIKPFVLMGMKGVKIGVVNLTNSKKLANP